MKGADNMGRQARVVEYYNERFKGSLSEQACDILEQLYDVDVVPDLRHCIYELSDSDVEKIVDKYNGVMDIHTDNNVFKVKILMYLEMDGDKNAK